MLSMKAHPLQLAPEARDQATPSATGAAGRIRLAVLDGETLFRESLGRLLAAQAGFELVAEYGTAAEMLSALANTAVDVVLLDLDYDKDEAHTLIPAMLCAGYSGTFLVMTSHCSAAATALALRQGASGIFLKSKSSAHLVHAIQTVAAGGAWVDRELLRVLVEWYPKQEGQGLDRLTEREQTVLRGVLDGLTNRKIAVQIGVSESAIKATLQQLFAKAGVRTRSQLVGAALAAVQTKSSELESRAGV